MHRTKIVWILLGLVALFGSGLIACRSVAPSVSGPRATAPAEGVVLGTPLAVAAPTKWVKDLSELPQGTVSHVAVVYFHRTERCAACLNAENYTRETLETNFADQLKHGKMSFQVLDAENPENAPLVEKFDAAGSALYLGIFIQGTEYLCPNQDIWFYTTNKYLFVNTLKKKLTALVERG